MKFKIAVIGLLTAILATCVTTSYILIKEAKAQTYNTLGTAKIAYNYMMYEGIYGGKEELLKMYAESE